MNSIFMNAKDVKLSTLVSVFFVISMFVGFATPTNTVVAADAPGLYDSWGDVMAYDSGNDYWGTTDSWGTPTAYDSGNDYWGTEDTWGDAWAYDSGNDYWGSTDDWGDAWAYDSGNDYWGDDGILAAGGYGYGVDTEFIPDTIYGADVTTMFIPDGCYYCEPTRRYSTFVTPLYDVARARHIGVGVAGFTGVNRINNVNNINRVNDVSRTNIVDIQRRVDDVRRQVENVRNVVNTQSPTTQYIPQQQQQQQQIVIQQQPQQRYAYPTPQPYYVQPQYPTTPRVGVTATPVASGYKYVNIAGIPYTGVDSVGYILTLIAVSLGAGVVFFLYKGQILAMLGTLVPAFAGRTAYDDATILYEEVIEDNEPDDLETRFPNEGDAEQTSPSSTDSLTLEKGENGPKLSFLRF